MQTPLNQILPEAVIYINCLIGVGEMVGFYLSDQLLGVFYDRCQ